MSVSVSSLGVGSFATQSFAPTLIDTNTFLPVPVTAGALGAQSFLHALGLSVFSFVTIGPFQINTAATFFLGFASPIQIRLGASVVCYIQIGANLEPGLLVAYDSVQAAPFPGLFEFTRVNPPAGGLLQAGTYGGTAYPLNTNISFLGEATVGTV